MGSLLAVFVFLYGVPDIAINWLESENQSINVHLEGSDKLLDSCTESGLEYIYTYRLQVCKRRPIWLDVCQDSQSFERRIKFDPISRNYEVRERVNLDPNIAIRNYSSKTSALKNLRLLKHLELSDLAAEQPEITTSKRAYLSIRVSSECQGEYNSTVASISRLVTLGLVRMSGFDTGWVDFWINNSKPGQAGERK